MRFAPRSFPLPGIVDALCVLAMVAVSSSAAAADMRNGERLYGVHCAVCHGANGMSDMPGAPNLKRGRALLRPDAQIALAIRQGRGTMPGYFGVLTDREILDVIAYVRTLG